MKHWAYYNEFDAYAASWLRGLIAAGHIAPGTVDERSIEDVRPDDLRGFTQCHFFAGIGVWSHALRRTGWPDDRPVWTGSCPCQPFSAAGQGTGFADERHLWPAWYHLITQRQPGVLFGEQVASKDAEPWLDLVQTDMEALGHAFGAVAFPSAGVGAPHIRDRTYWVAYARGARLEGGQRTGERTHVQRAAAQRSRAVGGMGNPDSIGTGRNRGAIFGSQRRSDRQHLPCDVGTSSSDGSLAHSDFARLCGEQGLRIQRADFHDADGRGPVNGSWADADWIPCRDGKWRPVEPGTFPLAHGAPARVGRLRAYGNAINAEAARVFIESVMESIAS